MSKQDKTQENSTILAVVHGPKANNTGKLL